MIQHIKPIMVVATLVAACISWLPAVLFWTASYGLDEELPPPKVTAASHELLGAWSRHNGFGPYGFEQQPSLRLDRQSPWGYLMHRFCGVGARDSAVIHECVYGAPYGQMPIYWVTSTYMGVVQPDGFWEAVKFASIEIWLSRNWSAPQVAQYLLEHDPASQPNI